MSTVVSEAGEILNGIGDKAKGVIGKAQTEEKKGSMWKVYLPAVLILGAACAAFYALVVGSGTVALGAIGAFVLALFLIYYFVSGLLKSVG